MTGSSGRQRLAESPDSPATYVVFMGTNLSTSCDRFRANHGDSTPRRWVVAGPGTLTFVDDAFYSRVVGLRAVRRFAHQPLDPEHLRMILDAARWTGSSKNRQDWSFVVIDDPEVKRAVAATGDFTDPLAMAPVAVIIVQEPGGYEFDSGRVAQNAMLAAAAIGVASCPVTLHRDGDTAAVIGLPDGSRCRYAIALGYPAPGSGPARYGGRKPLDDLVHHNRYRQAPQST